MLVYVRAFARTSAHAPARAGVCAGVAATGLGLSVLDMVKAMGEASQKEIPYVRAASPYVFPHTYCVCVCVWLCV